MMLHTTVFLTPDNIKTVTIGGETLTIKQKIVPDDYPAPKYVADYVRPGQPMKPCALLAGTGAPKGITIHNTELVSVSSGTNPAEQYTRATYNGNMGGVIIHFYVWHDEIWQLLDETERGWHATDGSTRRSSQRAGETIGGNLDTIAIEAIGSDAATETTVARLVAYLLQTPVKHCPAYILPHWESFIELVVAYYNTRDHGLHRVQTDAFREWTNALSQYQRLVADGYEPYMVMAAGLFKIQLGAFREKANAEKLVAELNDKGYVTWITTKAGTPVSMSA